MTGPNLLFEEGFIMVRVAGLRVLVDAETRLPTVYGRINRFLFLGGSRPLDGMSRLYVWEGNQIGLRLQHLTGIAMTEYRS